MQVALVRVAPNGQVQRVPISRSSTFIGRNDDCHIRIRSAGMSRKHCEILLEGGELVICDLGSSNGTYINQERIESQPVSAGDLVSVGGLVFLVEVNGQPEDIDAALLFEDGLPEVAAAQQNAPQPAPSMVPAGKGNDDSSMMDFEFDLDDEDDDQPPL
ncbi:MAG: FHA domain-containing protein [Phycisphaerales bacterium]|nr:FHA domain-containing protein [Phycisphaerales bacterium]